MANFDMDDPTSSVRKVPVNLRLRNGWYLQSVLADVVGFSPVVVLVLTSASSATTVEARFDLDKRAFYDEVPFGLSPEASDPDVDLVEVLDERIHKAAA